MEKRLLGTLFVCLAFAGVRCAAAEFPLNVTAIAVEGSDEIATSKILHEVEFGVGDVVVEEDIRGASQAIYDLGWFSEVLPHVGDDGSIVFSVTENPIIEEFEITGNINRKTYRLFGVELFDAPIVSTSTVRRILRDNDLKKGKILHLPSLKTALNEIVEKYSDNGYLLIAIGDVKPGPILTIPIVEVRVAGSVIRGLSTVPEDIAAELLDLPLNEPLQRSELQRVMTAIRKSVYFSNVEVSPIDGPERDAVLLQWTFTERPLLPSPVAFTTVIVDDVTQFPIDVASQYLGDLPDGVADNYAVLRMLEPLYNLYYDAGFIMATFTFDRIDGLTLYLRAEEGIVSQISIAEGTETQGRVLRRNIALHVGRVLTYNDLRVSYQRLNALDYFETVNIEPVWGDDGVHVQVSVTDKKSRGGMNGSVAVDPSSGQLTGEVSVSQKNLLGTGQDVSVSYNRELSDGDDPTDSTWSLGYSTVAYFSGFDRVDASLYRTLTDDTANDVTTTYLTVGGSVTFGYPVADYTDLKLSYTHETVRDTELTNWTPVEILGVALAEDSSDDPYAPNRGTRRSLSIQKAGGFSVGEEFTKLDISWVRFTPVYGDWFGEVGCSWATRCKLGWGTQGLSSTYAYDLGGATSVRGFSDESEDVDRIFIANLECRIEPADGFTAASFFDWGVDLERIRADEILASTGVELGVLVAGIFVRLDVVWVLGDGAAWMPRFDFAFGSMF
jgi:outer membrane protein assembly factor BamA